MAAFSISHLEIHVVQLHVLQLRHQVGVIRIKGSWRGCRGRHQGACRVPVQLQLALQLCHFQSAQQWKNVCRAGKNTYTNLKRENYRLKCVMFFAYWWKDELEGKGRRSGEWRKTSKKGRLQRFPFRCLNSLITITISSPLSSPLSQLSPHTPHKILPSSQLWIHHHHHHHPNSTTTPKKNCKTVPSSPLRIHHHHHPNYPTTKMKNSNCKTVPSSFEFIIIIIIIPNKLQRFSFLNLILSHHHYYGSINIQIIITDWISIFFLFSSSFSCWLLG